MLQQSKLVKCARRYSLQRQQYSTYPVVFGQGLATERTAIRTPSGVWVAHTGAWPLMARLPVLACLTILTMYGAAGRELQQAAGNVQPTSLAAVQNSNAATNNLNTQRAISNSNTGTVTATAIQPTGMQKRTLDQVNADAPVYTDPTTNVAIRPVARQAVTDGSTAGASPSSTVNAKPASATVGVVNPYDVKGASPLDKEIVSGDFISQIVGVRIATPFFGTGFNFCVGTQLLLLPVRITGQNAVVI